jgi:hypothetical protein
MAKSPEQIDHAAEFWDRHLAQPYIIDEKSLSLLDAAIQPLKAKGTFSLEHIQALVLSVSLSEGQIRDCIRLAIDSSFMEIDPENPVIKDVRLDFRLLNSVRDRRLSLGGFFALNTTISTVSRFWSGAELGFRHDDFPAAYAQWDDAQKGDPAASFDDLKASLAFVFAERNRYVHEFSRLIADTIGEAHDNDRFISALEHVFLLVRFFQHLKTSQYGGLYSEHAPSRGRVGKELNALKRKIASEFEELDALLRSAKPVGRPYRHDPQEVRKSAFALRAAHSEYLSRLASFIYYALGPGTITYDFVYGAHLEELQRLDERLVRALSHQTDLNRAYGEGSK